MKPHDLELIESRMTENDDYDDSYVGNIKFKHWCKTCGHCHSDPKNACNICQLIKIKEAMTYEEFKAYDNKHFKGVDFK